MDYETVKEAFTNKDAVILFDTETEFDWGNLTLDPRGILLSSLVGRRADGVGEYFYPYDEISVVADGGFKYRTIKPGEVEKVTAIKVRVYHLGLKIRGIEAVDALLGGECHKVAGRRIRVEAGVRDQPYLDEAVATHDEYLEAVKGWLKDPRDTESVGHSNFCFGDPVVLENIVDVEPSGNDLVLTQEGGARAILSGEADLHLMNF